MDGLIKVLLPGVFTSFVSFTSDAYTVTGQSSSDMITVPVIVALVMTGILMCLCMTICIIGLTIALCCTCSKYRKAKRSSELVVEETKQENKPSIHNLPLPPIPTEDHTLQVNETYEELTPRDNNVYDVNDQVMQGNEAYGINSLRLTLEANQECGSKVSTDQQDRDNAVHLPLISKDFTKESGMQGKETMNESTDKAGDYLKLLSANKKESNEETVQTQSAISNSPTDDHQDGLGGSQLVERSEYYNYYDYI